MLLLSIGVDTIFSLSNYTKKSKEKAENKCRVLCYK